MTETIEKYDQKKHDTGEIKEVLSLAVGRPTLDKVAYLIEQFYTTTGRSLFVALKEGKIKGIIGIENTRKSYGFITHLAVHPDIRKKGIANRLVKHVTAILELDEIEAETDQDAVEFYNACGFQTKEIDSPCVGVRRYRCIKSLALEV